MAAARRRAARVNRGHESVLYDRAKNRRSDLAKFDQMFQSVSFPVSPFHHLRRVLKSETARGAATSIGVSGCSALVSFAMLTALARLMPGAEFGQLASWMNSLFF